MMLGRASWMRLPEIVGVELTGKPQPGITATGSGAVAHRVPGASRRWSAPIWSSVARAPPPGPSAIAPPSPTWAPGMAPPRPCSSSTSKALGYLKLRRP